MRLFVFLREVYVCLEVLFRLRDQLHDSLRVFNRRLLFFLLLLDGLLNAFFLAFVHHLSPLNAHLCLREGLLAISQTVDVSQSLLLNHLEFFDHLWILKVDFGCFSHGQHFLGWSLEIDVHHSDQVLFCKLHLLNRHFVQFCFFNLVKLFGHFVVFYALVDNQSELIDLFKVLQFVLDMERKLFDLLLNQVVNLSVYFLHFNFNFFVLHCLEGTLGLWMLPLDELRDRFNLFRLTVLSGCSSGGGRAFFFFGLTIREEHLAVGLLLTLTINFGLCSQPLNLIEYTRFLTFGFLEVLNGLFKVFHTCVDRLRDGFCASVKGHFIVRLQLDDLIRDWERICVILLLKKTSCYVLER